MSLDDVKNDVLGNFLPREVALNRGLREGERYG